MQNHPTDRLSLSRLSPAAHEKAKAFLTVAAEFHLGALPTEQAHPGTRDLSRLAREDLPAATEAFLQVELQAYEQLRPRLDGIRRLSEAMRAAIGDGRRVYFCGCGATGRLSLALEWLLGRTLPAGQVRAFMAGGDFALVRSIENFEDHPEYGARQLEESGFQAGDLLVACTEGGETPFVIGATEHAAGTPGGRPPWFLYCNPDEILSRTTLRSRQVLEDARIEKLNLSVGPMAITGSTRLQASSVLMFAAGAALARAIGAAGPVERELEAMIAWLRQAPIGDLAGVIKTESAIYSAGGFCLHRSTSDLALTVLTDLTERSPTFSLPPLENTLPRAGVQPLAWTYFELPSASSPADGWQGVLGRAPRAIEWDGMRERFGAEAILGFDFSNGLMGRRAARLGGRTQEVFEILPEQRSAAALGSVTEAVSFHIRRSRARFELPASPLLAHLALKLLLNASSTLVMGRVGRFEGNVMTWVKPSNHKLVDRSIRYVQLLLQNRGLAPLPGYNEVALELFDVLDTLAPDEPAVLRTCDRFLARGQTKPAG